MSDPTQTPAEEPAEFQAGASAEPVLPGPAAVEPAGPETVVLGSTVFDPAAIEPDVSEPAAPAPLVLGYTVTGPAVSATAASGTAAFEPAATEPTALERTALESTAFEPGISAEPTAPEPTEPNVLGFAALEPTATEPTEPNVLGFAALEPDPAAQPTLSPQPSRIHRARLAFRGWRRGRPFWGGLIVLLGAGEILTTYQAPFGIIVHFGLYGLAGYLVPILLGLLGLMIVFEPAHRTFYSILAVLAALGTWLTSNLGGFFVGMLLGLVGGCLAFGWQYGERSERPARAQRTRRRRIRARPRAHAAE